MKRLFIRVYVIVFLTFHALVITASAWNDNLMEKDEDMQLKVWNNSNIKIISTEKTVDEYHSRFSSFDVSEDGDYLIGINTMFKDRILMINHEDMKVTEFRINSEGTFFVNWNGENIQVLFVRGNIVVEFTKKGKLIAVYDATKDFQYSKKHSITVDGTEYYSASKTPLLNIVNEDSSLLIQNINGKETIIYDGTIGHVLSVAIFIILFHLIVLAFVFAFVKISRRKKTIEDFMNADLYKYMGR